MFRFLLLELLLTLLLASPGIASSSLTALETKRVLILFSMDKGHPSHGITEQAIIKSFQANKKYKVQLFNEYLDHGRFSGSDKFRAMADFLRKKYADISIDVVITVYPTAIDFLRSEEKNLFPGVPIVAAEITRDYAEHLASSRYRSHITGTIMGDNISGLIESALRMLPDTKRAVLITGSSSLDAYGEQFFRKGFKPYAGRLELIEIKNLPMSEILTRVGSLPPDTIILYHGLVMDAAGQSFVPREALALIARAANSPIFGAYDAFLGHGIVGGHLISIERQGNLAAELALRVMDGESPSTIPFGGVDAYVDIYDWRELKKWHIHDAAVPPGAIIRHRQPTLWETYRREVIFAGIVFLIQAGLIIALLIEKRRRKVAELTKEKLRFELAHAARLAVAGEMTGSIAHEINQPLAAILSNTEAAEMILESGADRVDQLRSILADIRRDDLRASEVIRRLRLLLAKNEVEKTPFIMNEAIMAAETVLRPEARRRQVTLDFSRATTSASISLTGDRIQFQQVLLILVLNAMDAVAEVSREHRKIIVAVEVSHDTIDIAVRDYGLGISSDHLPKLFESFFSTKRTGMGLGLPIARTIVESQGGRIWAEEGQINGAVFHVELPITRGTENPSLDKI